MNISASTFFDEKNYQISMNNSFESEFFETDPKFERTIHDIKDNRLKSISSASTNLSAIKYFDGNFDPLFIKNNSEATKFEPEPTFEKTINEIKSKHLKNITSIDMNVSDITPKKLSSSSEYSYNHWKNHHN